MRNWRDEDLAPFAAMNADLVVRAFFYGLLSREESDQSAARIQKHLIEHAGVTRRKRPWARIGMTRSEADDFEHPGVPEGYPMRSHVLYRVQN